VLVKAMEMARQSGPPAAAELVAAECVVHAETKDHLNWELMGMLASKMKDETGKALKEAYEPRRLSRRLSCEYGQLGRGRDRCSRPARTRRATRTRAAPAGDACVRRPPTPAWRTRRPRRFSRARGAGSLPS
jgi:hypothetical protein